MGSIISMGEENVGGEWGGLGGGLRWSVLLWGGYDRRKGK